MKKTKKLVLNVQKVRELVDTNLDQVKGGYFHAAGSDWCSSAGARKCSYGCNGASAACLNR